MYASVKGRDAFLPPGTASNLTGWTCPPRLMAFLISLTTNVSPFYHQTSYNTGGHPHANHPFVFASEFSFAVTSPRRRDGSEHSPHPLADPIHVHLEHPNLTQI